MRFSKSDALADEGVAAVNMLFNQLGWIFREHSKRDVGIDAQVEICQDGFVTSRLLALQIKAGESYFTEPTADGWTYRDDKHLDYYLTHSLPVLVVLYHPKNREAWWQHVSDETTRRTGFPQHTGASARCCGRKHQSKPFDDLKGRTV